MSRGALRAIASGCCLLALAGCALAPDALRGADPLDAALLEAADPDTAAPAAARAALLALAEAVAAGARAADEQHEPLALAVAAQAGWLADQLGEHPGTDELVALAGEAMRDEAAAAIVVGAVANSVRLAIDADLADLPLGAVALLDGAAERSAGGLGLLAGGLRDAGQPFAVHYRLIEAGFMRVAVDAPPEPEPVPVATLRRWGSAILAAADPDVPDDADGYAVLGTADGALSLAVGDAQVRAGRLAPPPEIAGAAGGLMPLPLGDERAERAWRYAFGDWVEEHDHEVYAFQAAFTRPALELRERHDLGWW